MKLSGRRALQGSKHARNLPLLCLFLIVLLCEPAVSAQSTGQSTPQSGGQSAGQPSGKSGGQPAPPAAPTAKPSGLESLSTAEFSRIVREFSEGDGYFMSDNFTSNETSYLHIVDKLRQVGGTGGAYIGVGPEQNFTYIAKTRPQVAFIVDIRRQAVIQHLMFKAVFHLAPNRAEFLSRLLSRPFPKESALKPDATAAELTSLFAKVAATDQAYIANLAEIKRVIQEDFQFPLNERDRGSLEYVYKTFRDEGLEISFKLDGGNYWGGYFPSLKDLIVQTDLSGKTGNFLANVDDYNYVREMHRKNLIIPVVGDFGGPKAFAAIADFLRKNGLTLNAFYTSNVEQYLFDGNTYEKFVKNVRRLPIDEKSHFIRAVFLMRYSHPAGKYGHLSATLLQPVKVFLKDFDEGVHTSYRELVMNHYISAEKP